MSTKLKTWSSKDRQKYLNDLKKTTYDVLVIGGGITGAGVLRECGLKGLKAALIEKDDFAFGTSSKSTRLAHGGVRYILNLEFGLVSEETRERDWLRDAYPNMARPVPIIYANYSLIEAIIMALFFKVYDALAGFGNYRNSRHINKKNIKRLEPNLMIPGLHSGTLLYECIINDARLTLEVIKEGVILGATAVNYAKANKIISKGKGAVGVEVVDRETNETFIISAKTIVNATGPWTDLLMPKGTKPLIRPAKGIHIAVKRESIGNVSGLYVKSTVDKRGVFLLAHGEFTHIGTTDTDYRGDLNECYTNNLEYEYFKGIINHCFPDAKFAPEDLLGSYAGSRPLVIEPGVSADKTSRREYISEVMPGFFVIAGGKLTIFRAMAEKLLTFAEKKKAVTVQKSKSLCSKTPFTLGITRKEWDIMIGGNPTIRGLKLDEKTTEHVYQNYGRGGIILLESIKKDPSLKQKIADGQPNIWAELDYALDYEQVTHVKDFLLRRTDLSLHQRGNHDELGRKIAARMAQRLGWDKNRAEREVSDYVTLAFKNKFFLKKTVTKSTARGG